MNSTRRPPSSGTRQEIERMIADLRERVLTSPQKAAKILSHWIDRAAGASKKRSTKTEKKPAA